MVNTPRMLFLPSLRKTDPFSAPGVGGESPLLAPLGVLLGALECLALGHATPT